MINKHNFKKYYLVFFITSLALISLLNNTNVFASEDRLLNSMSQIEMKSTSKYISSYYVVYNAKQSNMVLPPNYYYYNDGQFRGNLKLYKWYDEKETTGLFKCYYSGTVYNGPAPGSKAVISKSILPSN
ncbi:hypothetical protein P7H50_08515 [Enterococcus durans]|uniref:hypothetical protein n=1 Tax=Enterococcus durans TaxID=53345 RepID=UPI00115B8439|nr:hypothetical protein [Enterococcus durans]MDT2836926.1 hypothetical protein [Enterococcus durans]